MCLLIPSPPCARSQHIMDVFLGVFLPTPSGHHIWELDSDLHLHNRPPAHLLAPLYPDTFNDTAPKDVDEAVATPRARDASIASIAAGQDEGGEVRAPGGDAVAPIWTTGKGSRNRRHALFDYFYNSTTSTSFDELLSRPYLHTPACAPKPPQAHAAAQRDERPSVTEHAFEGRDAPAGWLQIGADGTCIDHPLWTQAVTWQCVPPLCAPIPNLTVHCSWMPLAPLRCSSFPGGTWHTARSTRRSNCAPWAVPCRRCCPRVTRSATPCYSWVRAASRAPMLRARTPPFMVRPGQRCPCNHKHTSYRLPHHHLCSLGSFSTYVAARFTGSITPADEAVQLYYTRWASLKGQELQSIK